MIHLSGAPGLLVLSAALALPVFAQPAVAPAVPVPPVATAPAGERPALAGYQAFDDGKPVPWLQANDTVRAIGGWRAYAREAQQERPVPAAPAAGGADPHAGHGQH